MAARVIALKGEGYSIGGIGKIFGAGGGIEAGRCGRVAPPSRPAKQFQLAGKGGGKLLIGVKREAARVQRDVCIQQADAACAIGDAPLQRKVRGKKAARLEGVFGKRLNGPKLLFGAGQAPGPAIGTGELHRGAFKRRAGLLAAIGAQPASASGVGPVWMDSVSGASARSAVA